MRGLLRPDARKLLLFGLLLAVGLGGWVQAWVFTDSPGRPALYDLLEPLPLWPLWLMLLAPLALLAWPLRSIGLDVMGGPPWLFWAAVVAYDYLLACLVVAAWEWVRRR